MFYINILSWYFYVQTNSSLNILSTRATEIRFLSNYSDSVEVTINPQYSSYARFEFLNNIMTYFKQSTYDMIKSDDGVRKKIGESTERITLSSSQN